MDTSDRLSRVGVRASASSRWRFLPATFSGIFHCPYFCLIPHSIKWNLKEYLVFDQIKVVVHADELVDKLHRMARQTEHMRQRVLEEDLEAQQPQTP